MEKLLETLRRDFPNLEFTEGKTFFWSPSSKQIFYTYKDTPAALWSLLHETAHALLGHSVYGLDIELLKIEMDAWEHAKKIAQNYNIAIKEEHIQNCLDSYRDWLHGRSICPTCGTKTVQQEGNHYRCFNCRSTWDVAASRFCRPYRQFKGNKKSPVNFAATGDSL